MRDVLPIYRYWCEKTTCALPLDPELSAELREMAGDAAKIGDAFYRELEFGTGGLRGVIGAGTNRMNVYTVARASQGLANYIKMHYAPASRSVALSRDSRIKSELFAKVAAAVFAANGISVHIYRELMPTPCLSYAVRSLGCAAGVMVTASHNPAKYNGYKVYGPDGCQITTGAASEIQSEIENLDVFSDVKIEEFDVCAADGRIVCVPEKVYPDFIEEVRRQSVLYGDEIDRSVALVYTPLNGTGLAPVTRALRESGFTNLTLVSEQAQPDGNFPTCPYPNPEIREAMELGIEYCRRTGAELLLATDPDCDRCGVAVRGEAGDYELLTGNETGLLLLDYICAQRTAHGKMPSQPVFVKTIVTTDLAERIAAHYGVKTINVLTGFKYIGEVIGEMEREGRADDYICGFEESYGYLTGTYVRDKDAVNAALMICEMFAFYRTRGVSLRRRLDELYKEYGYCLNTLHSYTFEGTNGFEQMQRIMARLREGIASVGGLRVLETTDYLRGVGTLPVSDVLSFQLENASLVVRPSGTEPKLKFYVCTSAKGRDLADSKALARRIEHTIALELDKWCTIF